MIISLSILSIVSLGIYFISYNAYTRLERLEPKEENHHDIITNVKYVKNISLILLSVGLSIISLHFLAPTIKPLANKITESVNLFLTNNIAISNNTDLINTVVPIISMVIVFLCCISMLMSNRK